jgi:hypothetical protein
MVGAADLPGVTEVAKPDVVGRVEPRVGTEVALGEGPKSLVDDLERRALRRHPSHGEQATSRPR